jgi:hypothetical protein
MLRTVLRTNPTIQYKSDLSLRDWEIAERKSMDSPLPGNSWVVLGSTESHGSGTVFTEYFRLTQSSIIFQFSNFTFIRFKQVLHKIVTC